MHKNQKKNVVTLMNYISTAGGIQDVRVLLTNTGSTVTSMTEDVRITMDAATISASIQLIPLSLNLLNATSLHPFMNMSALTKETKMNSMIVTGMVNVKKSE